MSENQIKLTLENQAAEVIDGIEYIQERYDVLRSERDECIERLFGPFIDTHNEAFLWFYENDLPRMDKAIDDLAPLLQAFVEANEDLLYSLS